MDWDWQQFVTPSSTPNTNTTQGFDCSGSSAHNNNKNNNTHFHAAFSPYVHQKHDSVAFSAPTIDDSYVAYPEQPPPQQLQQQHHHHQAYQAYAPSPVFVQSHPQETFQMQTPPPTRGSSIKRRSQRAENVMVDQQGMRQPDFAPAAFNFAAAQQPSVSWSQPSAIAPAQGAPNAPVWMGCAEDPFSPWSNQFRAVNPLPVSQPTAHVPPATIVRSASTNSLSYPTPLTAKKLPVTSSVDPSLLYTSPGRPASRPTAHERPHLAPAFPSTAGTSSPAKSSLQRSNTIASVLRPSPNIVANNPVASGFLARSNSAVNLPRRSSPLKRVARGSLSSISEASRPPVRTSVVLTVDANGMARTETRVIEDSPTKSIKEKYPSLWDESDSDSDSTASKKWPSRASSLAYNKAGEERQAKIAKLDPPADSLESSHLPRSNSTASLKTPSKAAYAAAAQLRRQGSAKKQQRPTSVHSRRNTLSSLNSSFENLATMDLNKDEKPVQCDAGSALRQVVAKRVSPPTAQPVRPDPVKPSASRPQCLQQPPNRQQHAHTHVKSQSVSYPMVPPPSTAPTFDPRGSFPVDSAPMALASVPVSFTNDMSSMTRCICQIPIDDGRLIQCSLCAMWSHSGCIGLDPVHHPPFVCSFCVNPIHPVRSSSMQNLSFNTWAVPGL